MTCAGSDADDERRKRRGTFLIVSAFREARARIVWCIVGTAVYQVGRASRIQPKNFIASKPGAHQTEAPAAGFDAVLNLEVVEHVAQLMGRSGQFVVGQ